MVAKSAFWSLLPEVCDTNHIQFRSHLARAPIVPVITKSDGHTEVEVTPGGAKVWVFDSNELWTSALNEVDFGAALFVVDKNETKRPSTAFINLLEAGFPVGFYGMVSEVARVFRKWQDEHSDRVLVLYVLCNNSTYSMYIPCVSHILGAIAPKVSPIVLLPLRRPTPIQVYSKPNKRATNGYFKMDEDVLYVLNPTSKFPGKVVPIYPCAFYSPSVTLTYPKGYCPLHHSAVAKALPAG